MRNDLTTNEMAMHMALDTLTKRRVLLHDFLRFFGTEMLEGMTNNGYLTSKNTEQGVEIMLTPQGAKLLLDMEGLEQ